MVERIRIGHKDGQHGLWVSPPGVDVNSANRFLLSSAQDMLKIHAQGVYNSRSNYDDSVFWRHSFEITYPDLGYIPLAFIGIRPPGGVCMFPPDLIDFVHGIGGVGAFMGIIGFKGDRLKVHGWNRARELNFHYTVFRYKLMDSF